MYEVTQNNGRMKLEPRFSLRYWVKDTTIDTEFGKVKISQDKITHHYTIKDAVEKCYQNVQVGPTLDTLLGKRNDQIKNNNNSSFKKYTQYSN